MRAAKKAFPQLNIDQELNRMRVWLMTSPKAKNHKGTLTFINKWLQNSYSRVGTNEADPVSEVLEEIMQEYLKDLWKNREHILAMNTQM